MHVPRELIPIAMFAMVTITIIGAPIARAIARRIEGAPRDGGMPGALPNDVSQRLERMEHAIDAIAVEVERIAEGQRFTSKLLAGRGDAERPAGGGLARTRD